MLDPFRDVFGHDRPKARLSLALGGDRLHHAWLFTGRPGIGKARVALRMAQALCCERGQIGRGPEALAACGQCRHCRRMDAGQHPDLLSVAPDGKQIKIEQVRDLTKRLTYSPFEGQWRVIIIHDAHLFGVEAANALLKTLEEPPARNLFILLTDQPQRLLPTTLSRCMTLRFGAFDITEVRRWLEAQGHPAERATLAAALAEGSLGRAARLAGEGQLESIQETLHALQRICQRRDLSTAMTLATKLAADRDALPDLLLLTQTYLRDLMLCAASQPPPAPLALAAFTSPWPAPLPSATHIASALQAIQACGRAIDGNVNPQIALESLLLHLATLGRPPAAASPQRRAPSSPLHKAP
jgi:DNA polymerase-3 subunit delta'